MAGADATRRLTAIVAADVAGYSRLVAADEMGTLNALRGHRYEFIDPLIAEHRGRIANTAGDSILAEFPSVLAALDCAVALQRGMAVRNADILADRRIEFRVGLHLGDVVDHGGDLLGDGVNLAARLEGAGEPGGICLSAAAHDQVRGRIDVAFEDLGPLSLKNIPQPVHAWRVVLDGQPGGRSRPARRRGIAALATIAGFAAVLAVSTGLLFLQPTTERVEAPATADKPAAPVDRPSIAVLPFTNMSNDAEQDYFSDGVTEDLITDLSRISGLFVIARNTVFTYKGRSVNVAEVAEDLGVRYVLEGSVRRSGARVRINAQLIDARTGGHVWADRFDRELGDIFVLQDDVTRQIVSALALQLTSAEQSRFGNAGMETSPEVYDLYLRGTNALRQYTPESILEARAYYLEALSLDPDYARAYAAVAFTYTAGGIFFLSQNTQEAAEQALRYGTRAKELDDTLPQAHFALAIAHLRQGNHDDALEAARKSVYYDPNYSDGYAALANVLFFSGEGTEAEAAIRQAMRLNPRYSATYIDLLARTQFQMSRYDEAIAGFRQCIDRDPALFTCRVFVAASYGAAGQIEEAQWEAQEILGLEPGFTLKTDIVAPQFLKPEDRARYQEGLRRAGIADG